MTFDRESDFEEAIIRLLGENGWEKKVLRHPTEKDLIHNWADILYENNRSIDRLNDYPLTDGEMQQILEQVAAELPAGVTIGKVNIDENRDLAVKFEVMNIPRIFIYKDGKIVNDMSGVQSKPKLLDALKNA